jgi:hypothetical protein
MVNERTAALVQQKLKTLGLDAIVPPLPKPPLSPLHVLGSGVVREGGTGGQQRRCTSLWVVLHGHESGDVAFLRLRTVVAVAPLITEPSLTGQSRV